MMANGRSADPDPANPDDCPRDSQSIQPFFQAADDIKHAQIAPALLVLVAYVSGILVRARVGPLALSWSAGIDANFAANHRGLIRVVGEFGFELPAVWLTLAALVAAPSGKLAKAIQPVSKGRFVGLLCIAILLYSGLDALGFWPYTWEGQGSGVRSFASLLLSTRQLGALTLWILWVAVVAPLVEEIAIRYGLLRLIAWKTGSAWGGVIGSSVIFAFFHLGNPTAIDRAHLNNTGWAFVLSLILGSLTVRGRGNIGDAIALHVARNGLEMATLLYAAAIY